MALRLILCVSSCSLGLIITIQVLQLEVILVFAKIQYFCLQKHIPSMMGDTVIRPTDKTEYKADKIAVKQAGVCH